MIISHFFHSKWKNPKIKTELKIKDKGFDYLLLRFFQLFLFEYRKGKIDISKINDKKQQILDLRAGPKN